MLRRIRTKVRPNAAASDMNTITSEKKKSKHTEQTHEGSGKKKKKKANKDKDRTLATVADEDPKPKHQSTIQELNPKAEIARPFVEITLRKKVNGLIQEFRKMKRGNDLTKMATFIGQTQFNRNRYKDVGCLDCSRVPLNLGPVDYIHANYVGTPANPRRFICTQGPLPNTCAEFWYMVVQEKCQAVIMLCNFMEMGTKKCAEYFPTTVNQILTFDNGGVVVKSTATEQLQWTVKTKTKLMVSRFEVVVTGQPPHLCTHYHWLDWPDRGVPEADLAPMALLGLIKDVSTPVVVHCSAGIGRTGAIVLIETVLELLHHNTPLGDMKDLLLQLRTQRNNSVQTEQQYLYVHQVLLLYLRSMHYIDPAALPALTEFTKEYKKNTSSSM